MHLLQQAGLTPVRGFTPREFRHSPVTEFSTVDALADFVRTRGAYRIGIDGVDGVGKTPLATELKEKLDYPLISLDDYLDRNKGGFIEYLSYSRLAQDLSNHSHVVIEGDCLLQVLARVAAEIDLLVYVKRLQHGVWLDERECEINGDLEAFIAKEKELIERIAGTSGESQVLELSEEIIRYHYAYRPHSKAHVTYVRQT